MKILFISMPTIHAIRWIENLKNTNHELFWFDIMDRGDILISDDTNLKKIIAWKERKIKYLKGEYFLRKKTPKIYASIAPFIEVTIQGKFENIIKDIQPDLVHSFEMQNCSYPILKTMQKFSKIKWMYSCWGSDLFYYQNFKSHRKKIEAILQRIDFLHTDCKRDYTIAKKIGFSGKHVGVIPGGTGYKLDNLFKLKQPIHLRKIILVKGYEHTFGRAINVLKALNLLKENIKKYQVVVFGAHLKTIEYIKKNNLNYKYFDKDSLGHAEVLSLMGKAKIYIGNSMSDGMPNTLLEAIVLNAFPIQSNPGNVSSEIIKNGVNGLLIEDAESINEIKSVIEKAIVIEEKTGFNEATNINLDISKSRLDFSLNKQKVIDLYNCIEKNIE